MQAVEMDDVLNAGPEELFADFYREITGEDLSDYQREVLRECIQVGGERE